MSCLYLTLTGIKTFSQATPRDVLDGGVHDGAVSLFCLGAYGQNKRQLQVHFKWRSDQFAKLLRSNHCDELLVLR